MHYCTSIIAEFTVRNVDQEQAGVAHVQVLDAFFTAQKIGYIEAISSLWSRAKLNPRFAVCVDNYCFHHTLLHGTQSRQLGGKKTTEKNYINENSSLHINNTIIQ